MNTENKEIIIIGDINCNYLDKKNNKDVKELFTLNGFIQLINDPTRITDRTETLIDVILSTKPENVCDIKVIPTAMSDHDTIGCRRKLIITNILPKQLDAETFLIMNQIVYAMIYEMNLSSQCILEKVFDHHALYISKRVKGKNLFG